jgi:aconitate hydratase
MGVLPLQLADGVKVDSLGLEGDEEIDITGLDKMAPKSELTLTIRKGGKSREVKARVRIDTPNEMKYYRSGGILPFVLDRLAK